MTSLKHLLTAEQTTAAEQARVLPVFTAFP